MRKKQRMMISQLLHPNLLKNPWMLSRKIKRNKKKRKLRLMLSRKNRREEIRKEMHKRLKGLKRHRIRPK